MSSISKQALLVENNTSFPDNNTGYITPASLRAFNVDMIDSTVNQATYSADLAELQSDIAALEAFTASQQPSFAALNAFTASASSSIGLFNQFTQSANAELDSLSAWTGSWNDWTSSINEIRSGGILQGYSTRLYFGNLLSASVVANVNGPIASINAVSDGTKLNTSSFNDYSASTNQSILEVSASLYAFSQSIDVLDNSFATTGSNTFTGQQTIQNNLVIEEAGNPLIYTQFTQDQITNKLQISQAGASGVQINSNLDVSAGYVSASTGFASGPNTTALSVGETSNIRFVSGSSYYNIQLVPDTGGDMAFSRGGASNTKVLVLAGTDSGTTSFQNNPISIAGNVSSLSIQAQSTAISGSGSYSVVASDITQTATSVTTNASASVRGTFGLTGQSGGDGRAILLGHSGSLVIGNSQSNAYYAELSYISSSQANSNTNLIFKTNTNTASLTVSGSANLFVPPSAPTSEFKRYLGGSGNIALLAAVMPQITGSNQISPTFNNNIFQGNSLLMRTPVSSSAWTISGNSFNNFGNINFGTSQATSFVSASAGVTVSNNFIGGTLSATAYKTQLYGPVGIIQSYFGGTLTMNNDSSSVTFVNSAMQGALTIHNSYNSATTTNANGLALSAGNVFMGTNNVVYASGSNTTTSVQRQFQSSALIGSAHSASVVLNGDNAQLTSTALIGHALVVTGSSGLTTSNVTAADRGTVIVGRFNSPVLSGNTVFAVGTGTSTTNRINALTIDSGSNSVFTGSVTITGSAYGNVVSQSISANTASLNLATSNFFTLTLVSGSTTHLTATNIRPGQTINLLITQPSVGTGSISYSNTVFDFPAGANYVATPITGSKDIISFISFDTSILYATSINNLG